MQKYCFPWVFQCRCAKILVFLDSLNADVKQRRKHTVLRGPLLSEGWERSREPSGWPPEEGPQYPRARGAEYYFCLLLESLSGDFPVVLRRPPRLVQRPGGNRGARRGVLVPARLVLFLRGSSNFSIFQKFSLHQ